MFDTFFNTLLDTYNISSTMLKLYEEKDKDGKVTSVTLFIPWKLVADNKITTAVIQPLLPEGWNATDSSRTQDQQEAIQLGMMATPSIAINEARDTKDALASYLDSKNKQQNQKNKSACIMRALILFLI